MNAPARLAAASVCLLLAGCGGDDEPDRSAATTTAPAPQTASVPATATTPEQQAADAVRECLAQAGYRATGGMRPQGTPGAPDYEILVAGPRGSAFIAFYDSLARAKRYEARVRNNAGRFDGASVERHGTVTTVWVELTDRTARRRIQDCVRQES